ncbi:hypothetical protein BDIM_13210 [Brevundimonas diminuta ATCC 11568]|nr:hypothetical protein BDIM_13210 [Brevundimonas diminuta ATCC 11568]
MKDQPERRGAGRARRGQRRAVQGAVASRPGPDGRDRQEVGEVERRDQGPPHVGVGLARQGSKPGLHGVQVLDPGDEPLGVEHALDRPRLGRRSGRAGVEHGHGQGQVAEGAGVRAERRQGAVALLRLGHGVRIEKRRLLLGDRLAEQDADALAFGEPSLAQLDDLELGRGLVEGDPARRPAIGERQGAQRVQQAGPGGGGQAAHGHHLEPVVPQAGRRAARHRRVGQPGVEEHGRIGRLDRHRPG